MSLSDNQIAFERLPGSNRETARIITSANISVLLFSLRYSREFKYQRTLILSGVCSWAFMKITLQWFKDFVCICLVAGRRDFWGLPGFALLHTPRLLGASAPWKYTACLGAVCKTHTAPCKHTLVSVWPQKYKCGSLEFCLRSSGWCPSEKVSISLLCKVR